MEASGAAAEYIGDGLDYPAWQENVTRLLDAGITVHCMCTINSLCLPTLKDHLLYLHELKKQYGRNQVNFTLNILRFPSFQSPLVLPDHLRARYAAELSELLYQYQNNPFWHQHEHNHLQRLIDYLDVVKTPHSDAFELPKLLHDFKQFYGQYDQRRGKNFANTFEHNKDLLNWYNLL
jgi:hypothetical protein